MRDIELLIDNRKVDLDEGTTISLTLCFEDLQNPTAIKNTFSKTVSLPATPRNSDVFNHIWNLDQQLLNFNPRVRTPFVLLSGGTLIESGYIEMNSITCKGTSPSKYNITLYGGLGEFFYSLSENNLEDFDDRFKNNFRHHINSELVGQSWNNDYYKYILSYSGQYDNFENDKIFESYKGNFLYGLLDIVYDVERDVNVGIFVQPVTNYLSVVTYSSESTPEFAITDIRMNTGGPIKYDPRLYYDRNTDVYIVCQPTLNKLIIFQITDLNIFEEIDLTFDNQFSFCDLSILYLTNYPEMRYAIASANNNKIYFSDSFRFGTYTTINTDIWINSNSRFLRNNFTPRENPLRISGVLTGGGQGGNIVYKYQNEQPYFTALYIANGEIKAAEKVITDTYILNSQPCTFVISIFGGNVYSFTFQTYNSSPQPTLEFADGNFYNKSGRRSDEKVAMLYTEYERYIVSFTKMAQNSVNSYKSTTSNTPENVAHINAVTYEGDPYNNKGRYIVSWGDLDLDSYLSYFTGITPQGDWTNTTGYYIVEETEQQDEHQRLEFRSYYQRPCIRLKHIFNQICAESDYEVELDPAFFNEDNPYWEKTWLLMDRLTANQSELVENRHGNIRSDDQVTFDLIIKNGISQKDFIVNYCKLFGLQLEKDKVKKKIYIWDRSSFFSQYKIEDWTNKIDYSKESTINPLVFNYKHAVMKYVDSGTQYETDYQSKYNREYGQLSLDTGYDFNTNTKNLIENNIFQNIVISEDYDLYFNGRNSKFEYRDDKILPAAYTKKNNIRENTDLSMCLLFDGGMQTLRQPLRITDDSQDMKDVGWYSWTRSDGTIVDSIPLMTRLINYNGDIYSLDFAKPAQIYYPLQNEEIEYPEDSTIYGQYWQEFLNERLNENTRIYTAYFHLTESEINQFRFNRFVKIKDTLWHVNKISDFDITKEKSTKVELVRMMDITNYTNPFIEIYSSYDEIPAEGGEVEIKIKSNTNYSLTINKL